LYGVTVFSNFIVPAYHDPLQVALFAPLLALIGFMATSCWALGGDIFRKTLNRYYRAANIVMGILLIYTAIASLAG
jgi:threonine/homoserine/homoserine lactone efflux protein